MIRVLVMIAVTGFLVSVVTLSTAVAIGGPDVLANGAWAWGRHGEWDRWAGDWDWNGHHGHYGRHGWAEDGPQTSREVAWTGGDSLEVDIPADVNYTQARGPGKLTISGPKAMVDAVEVEGGHISFAHDRHGFHWGDLVITMTAPSVNRFELSGSGKLSIAGYKQDKLALDLSGDADVSATGETQAVSLTISGSANADLAGLKARSANVDIQGSGDATLAPTEAANIDISGSGDVTLLTHPPKLQTNISGSGSLSQEGRETDITPPSPPAPPAPPSPPKHAKRL